MELTCDICKTKGHWKQMVLAIDISLVYRAARNRKVEKVEWFVAHGTCLPCRDERPPSLFSFRFKDLLKPRHLMKTCIWLAKKHPVVFIHSDWAGWMETLLAAGESLEQEGGEHNADRRAA